MPRPNDPAIQALLGAFATELVWAELLVLRQGTGFELRHLKDRENPAGQLKTVPPGKLRDLALHTEAGAFRPLKSAPTLRTGWVSRARDVDELGFALDQLYPGSVADWFATQDGAPPVTSYRAFTARQTGMYRITTHLTDDQAADVIRAVCHARFCLKQRLWSLEGLEPDPRPGKSAIPCLEPCAVLLELARKAVRLEQEQKTALELAEAEMETLVAALEFRLEHPDPQVRTADFAAADNPRRLQLLLEKCRRKLKVGASANKEE